MLRFGVDFRKLNNPIGVQTDKKNVHNFLTTHAIWLIIKLGRYLMATYIFTKFGEDRMKLCKLESRHFWLCLSPSCVLDLGRWWLIDVHDTHPCYG